MSLQTIANKKACGGSQEANTGKKGCLSLFGEPTHLMLVTKGFTIPKETIYDLEYITPLVQKGTMTPIIDASSFEDVSAEDTYITNSSGEKRLDLQGLPELKFTYEEGHEFYRELSKLLSYKSYDFILGDDMGNWMMAKTSAGDYKGFTVGHVTPEMRNNKVKGGSSESKALMFQFLDRLQYDENYAIFHADELTFTPQEVPAVNGAIITFLQIPADLDVDLRVSVLLAADLDTPVEGLDETNFVLTVNGVTDIIVSAVEGALGEYTITTTTAISTSDDVTLDLFDSTLNVNVANAGGELYRSPLATAIAV